MANQMEDNTKGEAVSGSGQASFENVKEDIEAARDTAAEAGEDIQEQAEEYVHRGRGNFNEWANKAEFAIIDHPLAAVGIAFAAGWLSARLFR